jgi:hypothetical protein
VNIRDPYDRLVVMRGAHIASRDTDLPQYGPYVTEILDTAFRALADRDAEIARLRAELDGISAR